MFKTICAQNCTRARFAFKDAQKRTICAFIKINQIYESFGVEFAYGIWNMQLAARIRCLKPFVHRFALVHVFAFEDVQKWTICAFVKMVKIYEFSVVEYVYRIVNMQLEPWIACLKPFAHRFALVHVLCSKMRKSARFVHSLK